MPITVQCSATDDGAVDVTANFPFSSIGDNKVFTRTFAEGCVLDIYEHNGHDDSDFFATYYDTATKSVKTIEYATTRGWTYANGAKVDATPEIIALAKQYEVERATPLFIRNSREDAMEVAKGKTCKVIKGRKIAKGTIVEVIGTPTFSVFGYNTKVYNVLVKLPTGGLIHTNVENLEVLNPEQYVITETEARKLAVSAVLNSNWRSMSFVGASKRLLAALGRSRI